MAKKDRRKVEFGDFQTPETLAAQVVTLLKDSGVKPSSVVEPTCGIGAFLVAAMRGFETARQIVGLEINPEYFTRADARLSQESRRPVLDLRRADFFSFDWPSVFRGMPQPILVLGNPPWVTSSGLGAMKGTNLPEKSNFQRHRGLDAITGKGNFDIAEWMLIKLLESATGSKATLAMLVKTSVARKVLTYAWRLKMPVENAAIYKIDSAKHFGVNASACLLVCHLGEKPGASECEHFSLDEPTTRIGMLGLRDGNLIADVNAFDRSRHLVAEKPDAKLRWRSGVKHDCSVVMELQRVAPESFTNGLGEVVRLEADYLFPMMKGSEVAARCMTGGKRWMIVPQRSTSDDTSSIRERAPRTWEYLTHHGRALDGRGSSIYRKRPRFAVFGVGPYTFAPWKLAICGLYKRVAFKCVGPYAGQPVVFDDTVYHLSFDSETHARCIHELLNSEQATDFFDAFVFWDAKRPITVEVLARLNLRELARARGQEWILSNSGRELVF